MPVRAVVLLLGALMSALHVLPARARDLPDFTQLVQKQAAAVVNISVQQRTSKPVAPRGSDGADGTDERSFRIPFMDPEAEDAEGPSQGSGLIISTDGFILTCAHVIEDANEILVRLNDRREFRGKLVGMDRRSDVAMLKIDAKELPIVRLGNASRLKVGEWVLAIGSPFGFASSATAGIVSAKSRNLPQENYIPFIQTDVAINPGNSGGPLFNLQGEVVGINSQIFSRTGGFMGLSFAIPIDIAMRIGDQLRKNGVVRRGWLGISLQEVTRDLAQAYGIGKPRGALIADMLPGGPAVRSDLQIGDIVVEYLGQPIERSYDLPPLVGMTAPGTRAEMKVHRRGQGVTAAAAYIGEVKEDRPPAAVAPRPMSSNSVTRPGIVLVEPSARQRERKEILHGLLVEAVEEGPARDAGVRPGDVILEVDGKRIYAISEFNRVFGQGGRERQVLLRIRRGAQALFLALPAGSG